MGKVIANKTGRAKVASTATGLLIEVPARKNYFVLAFVAFWLTFWTIGGITAASQLLFGDGNLEEKTFLAIWLCGWLAGETFAAVIVAWQLAGKETIQINLKSLTHKRQAFGLGPTAEYDLADVKNLRPSTGGSPFDMMRGGLEFWGLGGGALSFDYGVRTFRMGGGLEEAEAAQVIQQMKGNISRDPFQND